ncbi:MAG: AzlD domain-containing protein [Betaproteobacteria bacterium]|nr:AzlD domain-containing protein [Betaproteobacteria bacterium]MBK8325129.1 AzlD domain-containing protein [Betaproteobacteria bacterium]
MNDSLVWLVIVGSGVVTFLTRASFILFADPHKFPHGFRVALAFVPPAVLAAIVIPGLVSPAGGIDFSLANPRWIAGLVAIGVAMRVRNALASILAGMAALWILQALAR